MSVYSAVKNHMLYVEKNMRSNPQINASMIKVTKETCESLDQAPRTWALASAVTVKEGHKPSKQEIAAGVALRLAYGHLRTARRPVYSEDIPVGRALSKLVVKMSDRGLSQRLHAISKTHDIYVLEHHLGALLRMLDGNGKQPLFSQVNYAGLAKDLVEWQDPNKRSQVTSRWVRDTYAATEKQTTNRKEASQ